MTSCSSPVTICVWGTHRSSPARQGVSSRASRRPWLCRTRAETHRLPPTHTNRRLDRGLCVAILSGHWPRSRVGRCLSGQVCKFVGDQAAAGWAPFGVWASWCRSSFSRRSARSLVVSFQFKGLAAVLKRTSKPARALLDCVEVGEVVGGQRFSLDDEEVDLDTFEPGRVDRGVHQDRGGGLFGEPVDGLRSPVGRAVVDHPEHAVGACVRLLGHDLGDQLGERFDAGRGVAPGRRSWPGGRRWRPGRPALRRGGRRG